MINNVVCNYFLLAISSAPVVIASRCISVLPAAESALCAFKDAGDLYNLSLLDLSSVNDKESFKLKRAKLKTELINHLVVAILLGGCALNLVPYTAFIGAVGFLTYSKYTWKKERTKENPSYAVMGTGFALFILSTFRKQIASSAFNFTCTCISKVSKVVGAIATDISKVVKVALSVLALPIKGVKALAKGIHLIIVTPIKNIHKLGALAFNAGKIALRFMTHHPVQAVGVLVGALCVAFVAKHIGIVTGAAYAISLLAKGIFAGAYIAAKAGIAVTGYVLSSVPSVLSGVASTVVSIARFILRI